MIKVTDRFYIIGDSYGFAVAEKKEVKTGKNKGKDNFDIYGYYGLTNLDAALTKIAVLESEKGYHEEDNIKDFIDRWERTVTDLKIVCEDAAKLAISGKSEDINLEKDEE